MKVLVAIDAAAASRLAVREAAGRTWPPGSDVRLLEAVRVLDAAVNEVFDPGFIPSNVDRAKRLLAEESREFEAAGVHVSTVVASGRASRAIVEAAEQWGADFVYVAHDRRGDPKRGLGSTARQVLIDVPCSVCVVRPRPASALGRAERRLLVAIDASPAALRAPRSVASRSWPSGTSAAILAADEEGADEARGLLETDDIVVESAKVEPEPRLRLLDACERFGADLLVLGFEDPRFAVEAAELASCTVEVIR